MKASKALLRFDRKIRPCLHCPCIFNCSLIQDMSRQTRQHRLPARSTVHLPSTQLHTFHIPDISVNGRISRKQTSSFAPGNAAAIEAAVAEGVADGSIAISRPGSLGEVSQAAMPSSPPTHRASMPNRLSSHSSALAHGPSLSSNPAIAKRRASDGTGVMKKEKAATDELNCEHCGKAYKNGNCLTKHLHVVRIPTSMD